MSRTSAIVVNAIALVAAGSAFAEGAHHEPHIANVWGIGEKFAETPALGWVTITFAIFLFGLVRAAKTPLKRHLETRADSLEKSMAEAKKAKDDAERRAVDAEKKLAALEGEVTRMKADFTNQGKLEAQRIHAAAEEMAKKIGRDAEDTINAEIERARESLRTEASRLALVLAEERIKGMLTAADDERLKKTLIQDLAA